MTKVKMLATAANADGCLRAGKVYKLADDVANRYIAGGYAAFVERIADEPVVAVVEERADAPKPVESRRKTNL